MKKSTKPTSKRAKGRKGGRINPFRMFMRRFALMTAVAYLMLSVVGGWYVSHPWQWISDNRDDLPRILTGPLEYFGDRAVMISDGLGITGQDAVYDLDEPAPSGSVFFAGPPVRTGAPAVSDVKMIDRGEFVIGWSPSLKHPLWVAYHVPAEKAYEAGKRPQFRADPSASGSPSASAYKGSGYDRGHMAPNYAIATRFGTEAQKDTFYMSNISPQKPGLNRGPWREIEHRIADLWTARYGEIWVIVGCVPGDPEDRLPSGIDVPKAYWQLIVSKSDDGVRALALYMPKNTPFSAFPVHNIVTVDELERRTGLDFLAELPNFFEKPIEAHLPTRLWPVRLIDVFRLIALRFH
jgi:endonuclease G